MTNFSLLPKTVLNKNGWLAKIQYILFISVVIALSIYSFLQSTIKINTPFVFLAALIFAMLSFKKISNLHLLQRIILLYLIEMLFFGISKDFFHIYSLSISPALIFLVILSITFICGELDKTKSSYTETNGFLVGLALAFGIIIFHMSVLFLLLRNFYSYGYEHNPGDLLNMWFCFLVFIFSWDQLGDFHLRRITAIVLSVFFIMVIAKGF